MNARDLSPGSESASFTRNCGDADHLPSLAHPSTRADRPTDQRSRPPLPARSTDQDHPRSRCPDARDGGRRQGHQPASESRADPPKRRHHSRTTTAASPRTGSARRRSRRPRPHDRDATGGSARAQGRRLRESAAHAVHAGGAAVAGLAVHAREVVRGERAERQRVQAADGHVGRVRGDGVHGPLGREQPDLDRVRCPVASAQGRSRSGRGSPRSRARSRRSSVRGRNT